MRGRLLVTISSLFEETRSAAAEALRLLELEQVPVGLLVAPHIGGRWHLAKDPATLGWVRDMIADGHELILNGFDQPAQGRRAEFAALEDHEARLRLRGATRQMERLGLGTDIFVPPRWQLSRGTLLAARDFPFRIVGSTMGLFLRTQSGVGECDVPGWRFAHGRTLSLGEGYGAPGWWRRAVIAAARRSAARGNPVRLSASARSLLRPAVLRDFLAAVRAARDAGARPTRYSEIPQVDVSCRGGGI